MQWMNSESSKLAIGLMSGTSADGIDAVLVEICGCGLNLQVKQKHFITYEFTSALRERILQISRGDFGGSQELCLFHFYFGELMAEACSLLCEEAGVRAAEISFVGSHGQTLYHQPNPCQYLDRQNCTGTLQLGEASCIAERLRCPVVSDFRVRDMAAGGQGAPLVAYTEYLLYRSNTETIALQNIGGIGNLTLLPAGCALSDILAFDTGPGNMVMDAIAAASTDGRLRYDKDGLIAQSAAVNDQLLTEMMEDTYLTMPPPKTTGREHYGEAYVKKLLKRGQELSLASADILATATCFTAKTIAGSIQSFCTPQPSRLIVGGGGSRNPVLMAHLKTSLPHCEVMTNEMLGLDSNAKEAVAFAVLANEALCGHPNNAPSATGAEHPVIMGKISI